MKIKLTCEPRVDEIIDVSKESGESIIKRGKGAALSDAAYKKIIKDAEAEAIAKAREDEAEAERLALEAKEAEAQEADAD